MAIVYRSVKGSNLTANEVDGNFTDLDGRTTTLEAQLPGLTFDELDFSVSGSNFFVHIGTAIFGPYALPVASFVDLYRGAWLPTTGYAVNDIISAPGGLYVVIFDHTSGSTFDPGANDGMGHDFYQVLLTNPASPSFNRTDTTFTPEISDANSYNRCTNAAGCTVTIASDSDINFPINTELHFRQSAAGIVVIEGGTTATPVTINGMVGFNNETSDEGAVLTLKKISADEWDLFGRLAPITA